MSNRNVIFGDRAIACGATCKIVRRAGKLDSMYPVSPELAMDLVAKHESLYDEDQRKQYWIQSHTKEDFEVDWREIATATMRNALIDKRRRVVSSRVRGIFKFSELVDGLATRLCDIDCRGNQPIVTIHDRSKFVSDARCLSRGSPDITTYIARTMKHYRETHCSPHRVRAAIEWQFRQFCISDQRGVFVPDPRINLDKLIDYIAKVNCRMYHMFDVYRLDPATMLVPRESVQNALHQECRRILTSLAKFGSRMLNDLRDDCVDREFDLEACRQLEADAKAMADALRAELSSLEAHVGLELASAQVVQRLMQERAFVGAL